MRREGPSWVTAWAVSMLCHLAALAAVGQWISRPTPRRAVSLSSELSLAAIEFEAKPRPNVLPSPDETPPALETPHEPSPPPPQEKIETLPEPFTPVEPAPIAPHPEPLLTEPNSPESLPPLLAVGSPLTPREEPAECMRTGAVQEANHTPEAISSQHFAPPQGETPTVRSTLPDPTTLLTSIQPRYPLGSRLRGEEGLVVMRARVLPSGTVRSVEVVSSSTFPALDDAAKRAVRNARFRPFEPPEPEKEAEVELRIRFVLKEY